MRIGYLSDISRYKDLLNTDEETYVFVKNLTYTGINIYKEMIKDNKVYIGKMGNHVKDNWFNFKITGKESPEILEYKWKNITMRGYEPLLGDQDYTAEQIEDALVYIAQNFPGYHYSFARTPASIVKQALDPDKFMLTKDPKAIEFSYRAFQPGAIHVLPQYINKTIEYETHLDIHQAYSYIMMNEKFPCGTPVYTEEIPTDDSLYIAHYIGGKIKLKKNGFPLIQGILERNPLDEETKGTMIFADYDTVYDIADLPFGLYLTKPAREVLLENYDIIEPLEFLGAIMWPKAIMGIGKTFITKLYNLRTTTTNPALKNFAKMCNEYCAGMFERKLTAQTSYWEDLDGTKQDKKITYKRTKLDCSIGDFITDYLRLKISHTLQLLPHDWIIGYDTDGIFINQPVEKIEPLVKGLLGPQPGQFHFDGIYKQVKHLANKQYYGYTIDGKIFGKLAGVPNGDKVAAQLLNGANPDDIMVECYAWNQETNNYELTTKKANLGGITNNE